MKTEISIYQANIFRRLFSNKSFFLGSLLISIIFLFAIFGPIFSSHNYFDIHLHLKNLPPSKRFLFGTDELGRDIFTRTWWGARISLLVGITAAIIDLFIGVIWGTISSISRRKVDEMLMRICDIFLAVPYIIVVILLLVFMQPSLMTIIIAITLTGWINMARIVRGQILQIKEMEYVLAAKAIGANTFRIVINHLLPNCIGPIITTMTLTIPAAIFTEAFLSFLGLGVQAPIASWGVMINDGIHAIRYYPWRLFFPSLMIFLTMLGFNLIGDGMRDSFDTRL